MRSRLTACVILLQIYSFGYIFKLYEKHSPYSLLSALDTAWLHTSKQATHTRRLACDCWNCNVKEYRRNEGRDA